jgi:hypothetical protein
MLSVKPGGELGVGGSPFVDSTRQLVLRNRELVALAGPDYELAAAASTNLASNRVVEKAMAQSVHNQPLYAIERLTELPTVGAAHGRSIMHCEAALSCL